MPYEFYKVLHIVSILMIFLSLGALVYHAALGQGKAHPLRKLVIFSHGFGMLFSFFAGFGLMAKLGIAAFPWPLWIYGKFAIWIALGGIIVLFYKKSACALYLWWFVIVLGGLAAYLANFKPF